ncbi:SMI1/KNR4 family protein [Pseudomonas syringae]|uniref:SMI1/KNR4 family protein n=1 Tax=Pseudomonas syringae TaxID=317 RepID=UPI000E30F27A|nr:SMI1/KNR4 family protein [Pseudomonas syringae]
MNNLTASDLESLIKANEDVAAFGTPADAVADEWIIKAEQRLGHQLPDSYKWFLRNYAGGEVGTEEIYSIYGIDFDNINGGDIVFQHINGLKNKSTTQEKVVISKTDLGEVFFFNYNTYKDNECQIFLRIPSGAAVLYAENFYEYLAKRIIANS